MDKKAYCEEIQKNGNKCFRYGEGLNDIEWIHATNVEVGDTGVLSYVSGPSYGNWVFIKDQKQEESSFRNRR